MNNDTVWQPSLTLMSTSRIERLHAAAIAILEQTGLNVHHPEMRSTLARAGARLEGDARVFIPGELVEGALQTAKKKVVVHNRLGEPAMPLGPHDIYFGTGSDLIYTYDLETGERRPSVLDDVGRSARLCDALDEIDFIMSFALPEDVGNEDAEPAQYYELLANSIKPIIMTSFSGMEAMERMHAMACLIAGGDAAFRERPNYIIYGQFVSPLQHDFHAVERLVFCAEHEIPLIYIPTIMPGASGPITLAGSLALAAAESLAGLVMHQLQKPGAPFVFGACVSQLDMRTMLYPYGSPEWRLNDLVMAELSRYYGLPVFGTGGSTDSKVVDAQAGAEYLGGLLVAALAGVNLIHDVGYLDSGLTGSLESLVLGADQIRWVKRFLDGFEVTEEALALTTTQEVGPGHQFLDHPHTIKHLRRVSWTPYVVDRVDYDSWMSRGAKDYSQRARECARQLLESHQPVAVEDEVAAELRRLARM